MDRSRAALIAIRRILRVTELSARALSRETGLTISQLLVLQILDEIGEATAGTIAARVNLRQATVTSLLDKLEQRAFIRRKRSEIDRRKVWVELQAAGREALASAPDIFQERFRTRFSQLPDWEQGYAVAVLERVAALVDAEELAPEAEETAAALAAARHAAENPDSSDDEEHDALTG